MPCVFSDCFRLISQLIPCRNGRFVLSLYPCLRGPELIENRRKEESQNIYWYQNLEMLADLLLRVNREAIDRTWVGLLYFRRQTGLQGGFLPSGSWPALPGAEGKPETTSSRMVRSPCLTSAVQTTKHFLYDCGSKHANPRKPIGENEQNLGFVGVFFLTKNILTSALVFAPFFNLLIFPSQKMPVAPSQGAFPAPEVCCVRSHWGGFCGRLRG